MMAGRITARRHDDKPDTYKWASLSTEQKLRAQYEWRVSLIREWLESYNRGKVRDLRAMFLDDELFAAMGRVQSFW